MLLADELEARGLQTPDFSKPAKTRLTSVLPTFIEPRNPLDHTGAVAGDPQLFDDVVQIVGELDDHDSIIVFSGLLDSISEPLVASLKTSFAGSSKQVGVVWLGASAFVVKELEEAGLPVFTDIPQAASAFGNVMVATLQQQRMRQQSDRRWPLEWHSDAAGTVTRTLTEHNALQRVQSLCDIEIPHQRLVPKNANASSIAELAAQLKFPLVAKLLSSEMTHRSDHGGVHLGLTSSAEIHTAIDSLFNMASSLHIACEGVLLQEMHSVSYELFVGIKNDELFGPMLLVGRGGIDVELRPDVQIASLPLTAEDIKSLLHKLDSAGLFAGHRGRAVIDLDELAHTLAALGNAFLNDDNLIELEINPLAVTESGQVIALDALGTEVLQ